MTNNHEHYARYGPHHRQLRAQYAARVASGMTICAHCGKPIKPTDAWDLGHKPGAGPLEYAGPEHRRCNRTTALDQQLARGRRTSRDWL